MKNIHPSRRLLQTLFSATLTPLLLLGSVFNAATAGAQMEIAPRAAVMGDAGAAAVRAVPGMMGGVQSLSALSAPALSAFSAAPSLQAPGPLNAAPAAAAPAAAPALAPAAAFSIPAEAPALTPTAAASAPTGKGPSASGDSAAATPVSGGKAAKDSARQRLENLAQSAPETLAGKFDGNDAVSGRGAVDAAAPKYGKLGKSDPVLDPRTLPLAKYIIRARLPSAPASVSFADKVKAWGMMLNDHIGDCTVAACGHQIQTWTANIGNEQIPTDKAVLTAYEKISGYKPGQPDTDAGANLLNVVKFWRKAGIDGHKIGAFTSVDPTDFDSLRTGIWMFGGATLGIAMPKSAQKQDVWDVPKGGPTGDGEPGSWGGHAVVAVGYDAKGVYVVTWGKVMLMTWDFLKTYGDEAFVGISKDFLINGKTPNNGFDVKTLKTDLKTVTGARANPAESGRKKK